MRYQCFCNTVSRCLQASLLLGWLLGSGPGATVYAQVPVPKSPYIITARHLTVEQGLPSQQVLTVGQDQQGFIWIGTLEGAYRFDGLQFKDLSSKTDSTKNKPFNPVINAIRADHTGALWFSGSLNYRQQNVLILPSGKTQSTSFEQAFGRSNPFRSDAIYAYSQNNNTPAFRYLLTKEGRILRHSGQGRFQHIGHFAPPNFPGLLMGQTETANGSLIITRTTDETKTHTRLLEIDSLGKLRRQLDLPGKLKAFATEADGTVYLHRFVIADEVNPPLRLTARQLDHFLYRLSPAGKLTSIPLPFTDSPFPDDDRYSFAELSVQYDTQRGLYWISGSQVCFAWHPTYGVIFDLMDTKQPILSQLKFGPAFIDRTGAIWFATTNGVVVLTLEVNQFTRYLYQSNQDHSRPRHSIRGMVQYNNRLWVNAADSWWIDLKTNQDWPAVSPNDPRRVNLVNLYPALITTKHEIWSATEKLMQIDPNTLTITRHELQPKSEYNHVYALWHDGRQHIWLGFDHGLSVFDTQRAKTIPFTQYNQFAELAQNRVNGFFPDPKAGGGRYAASPAPANRSSRIWVAASSGLYLLDTATAGVRSGQVRSGHVRPSDRPRGIVARYNSQEKTAHRLPFDHIAFVHPDPDSAQVYWLATHGGGLIRWNRGTGNYEQFTQKQGLSDNTIYAIYEDRYHRLWLPSNNGLMAFHRQTHTVQVFHTKDGIADKEFNLTAHYRAPDGRLFLGGLNGITAFYPDQVQTGTPTLSPLRLTQYHKLDRETGELVDHLSDFEQQGEIRLTADDRLFSLSFSVLDYRYLGRTRLRYRIMGWQDKWVLQDQLELRINGLPAGHYTLEVQAQTINGDWISRVVSIPIRVAKPVYLQTWFLLVLAAALVFGVRQFLRYRDRQLVRENDRLEQEVARRTTRIEQDKLIIEKQAADLQVSALLKTRFFANVSHEFRTPLTLLLGPIQYLAKRIADGSTQQLLMAMERNANQLLTLVNSILDLTRLDSHDLVLTEQPADLSQLTQQTVGNFMAQAQYVGVHLRVSGADQPRWMALDTQKVETVLRNLLANALTYTPAGGSIQVSLSQSDQQARIEVADTGSGIHPGDLPHIFERYFQSNQTDKPLRGGTGIGLALCQEYCTLWGGTIRVSSKLNKGSTFVVTYPLRVMAPATDGLPDQPVAVDSPILTVMAPALSLTEEVASMDVSATSIRILLVDDFITGHLLTSRFGHFDLLVHRY